jgi:hypothetical protein
VKSGYLTAGPRLQEVELNKASNPLKIPFVVGKVDARRLNNPIANSSSLIGASAQPERP